MRRPGPWVWFPILLTGSLTIFHLLGSNRVPFHPDEASLLFQSRDLETYFKDPLSMAFDPDRIGQREQDYRALNSPLPKYILGLGRMLAGGSQESVSQDWEWSKTWQENLARNALPSQAALNGGRLASTALIPISLLLIYRTGRQFGGNGVGLLAILLLGSNALILLHTRRAMSEGTLIFGVSLAMLGLLHAHRRPFLAGLATGLAFTAKASALPLIPVGLVAALLPGDGDDSAGASNPWLHKGGLYIASVTLTILVLNPFLWSEPLRAAEEMWKARSALVQDQVQVQRDLLPQAALDTPTNKAAALIGHLFLLPPQFNEVGNYQEALGPAQTAYLRNPGHSLFRGTIAGGLMMMLTLAGFAAALLAYRRASAERRRSILVMSMASLAEFIALYAAAPVPYQRYYLPLIPFACLWAALGIGQLVAIRKGLPTPWAVPD